MTKCAQWCVEAREIAAAFRLGLSMRAGDPMAEFVRKVALEVGDSSSSMKDELSGILEALLSCHKRCDWLGVADYLEYELVSWLGRYFAGEESDIFGLNHVASETSESRIALGGSGQGGPAGDTEAASAAANSRNSC